MKIHIKKVVRKTLGVIILVAMFLLFIYNYQMSVVKASESADEDRNIVISEDGNSVKCLFSEKLEHFVPGYAARKGVAKTVKQLMIEDYGFTENEVCTLF